MRCRKAHTDLNGYAGRLADGKLAFFRNILFKSNTFDELHDNIIIAHVLAYVEYIHDIRIGKTSRRLRLSSELGNKSAVLTEFTLHDFDSHEPVQLMVFGLIDIGHTARSDTANNFVTFP